MISVAYIVNSFCYGGLERCVARLGAGLDRGRFRPVVICLTESGGAEAWIGRDDVPVFELRKRPGNDWRMVRRLAEVLKRERVDVAHSHNWVTLVETTLARRWAGTPAHVHAQRGMFHHGQDAARWKQAARRMATRWACSRADAVVAVAGSVRDDLIGTWGVAADSIQVIPNGVEVPGHDASGEAARRLRASQGIPADAIVVGSVGRLVPVKDFPTLIRAAAQMEQGGGCVHVVIVGDGPEMPLLREVVAELRVGDRVHLVGEQSNVGDWLKAMDIYVNCSLSEGMSQSVLEAMAMGRPLVVTDVGENGTLVGGEIGGAESGDEDGCGVIVAAGRPDELARGIGRMLPSPARMGHGQRATARHGSRYGLETMLSAYEDLYERLMPANQPQRPKKETVTSFPSATQPEPLAR